MLEYIISELNYAHKIMLKYFKTSET